MKILIPLEPFIFFESGDGYVYPLIDIKANSELVISNQIQIGGMFELYQLRLDSVLVGYYFKSSFAIKNGGGYLVTYLRNKSIVEGGEHEILLKLEELVIFNFPNKGTMAVSPKSNTVLERIMEHQ